MPSNETSRAASAIASTVATRVNAASCLPAISFFGITLHRERRWRFSLASNEVFYFAGIWQPAQEDWPEAYAVLTTAANPDVAPVHDRQMAVLPAAAMTDWLDESFPAAKLLKPLPAGSFRRDRVQCFA
jgi:putative SOS response-associated peptidase YedK